MLDARQRSTRRRAVRNRRLTPKACVDLRFKGQNEVPLASKRLAFLCGADVFAALYQSAIMKTITETRIGPRASTARAGKRRIRSPASAPATQVSALGEIQFSALGDRPSRKLLAAQSIKTQKLKHNVSRNAVTTITVRETERKAASRRN